MATDDLVPQNQDPNDPNKFSMQCSASEKVLVIQLHLTTINSKTELDPYLASELKRKFSQQPATAIVWVFQNWRDRSPHFPTIADLQNLFNQWHQERVLEMEAATQAAEKLKLETARAKGELVGFVDLLKKLADVANQHRMPEPPLKNVGLREVPPPIPFTKEQIDARREKEQEEIKRYLDREMN